MARKNKKKKAKAVPKKVEQTPTKIARPNFTLIALEYRKNESKYLLEKVKKLGYLKDRPKPKEEDGEDK